MGRNQLKYLLQTVVIKLRWEGTEVENWENKKETTGKWIWEEALSVWTGKGVLWPLTPVPCLYECICVFILLQMPQNRFLQMWVWWTDGPRSPGSPCRCVRLGFPAPRCTWCCVYYLPCQQAADSGRSRASGGRKEETTWAKQWKMREREKALSCKTFKKSLCFHHPGSVLGIK